MAKRAKKITKTEEVPMMMWSWHSMCNCGHGGFISRLVFAGLLVWILNMKGIIFDGISWWILALLVLAFAMMKKGHCNCGCNCGNNCCK